MKKIIAILLVITLQSQFHMYINGSETVTSSFSDVPNGHWAEADINQLRDLAITNGIGDNMFGMGDNIKRAEFVAFLVRLRGWNLIVPQTGSFADNVNPNAWYFSSVETAVKNGVIDSQELLFRPLDKITREEMAIMIVNSLGYNWLALERNSLISPFSDVNKNIGFISLLTDFGIINGVGNGKFAPLEHAKREEAAAILIRMYNKLEGKLDEKNAFYAVSSYSQKNLIGEFNTISFGWAKLAFSKDESNIEVDLSLPVGYEEPLQMAALSSKEVRLSIYGTDTNKNNKGVGLIEDLVSSSEKRSQVISAIIEMLDTYTLFDGVTIDFEDVTGVEQKANFNLFFSELSDKLKLINKSLTVMVPPTDSYKGYDFKEIGRVADQIIMMAHDYNTKALTNSDMELGWVYTPIAPLENVYEALSAITDTKTGVADHTKIGLQINFGSAQWGVDEKGVVINQKPYLPTYESIYKRLIQTTTTISFGVKSRSPYATYHNDTDGLNYTIWYEDTRSVEEKIKLAKMFGVYDISLWRLGNIPDYEDVVGKQVYMNILDVLN